MLEGRHITVVMPAYNAEATLKRTYDEIPRDIVDHVILVDDCSTDQTRQMAAELDLELIEHRKNGGYGRNQKSCYAAALKRSTDIIVMLHPDYQYTPQLIPAMCHMITSGQFDVVLGSRILGGEALEGGMPTYKYVANRILTFIQNIFLQTKISEFHTGYRAYSREVLESINYEANSDDFIFDNQALAQIIYKKFRLGEISCPTKYFPEASSIHFLASLRYGFGCLLVSLQFRLSKWNITKFSIFD